MDMPAKIYYRDVMSKKIHFTRGRFIRWERGGVLNTWGAIVQLRGSVLFIPRYCIHAVTLDKLPPVPEMNHTFRFHWLDGKVEDGIGDTVESAFHGLGYGGGAWKALDYWEQIN